MKTLHPYFLLLFFFNIITITICLNTTPAVPHQCIRDQQLLLFHFKKSLRFYDSSPTPSKFISWNSSTNCCSWDGVSCSTNGHVVGLDISSQSISGGIDNASSLFNLQHLESLNLAHNGFGYDSRIPSAIGKLTNLRYLNLSYNSYYTGKIPIEISQLTRLDVLDISDSYNELGTQLESPKLSMLFRNLTDLTELYLDGVDLSAQGTEWCQAISSSLPNLRVLSLSRTQISGPVDHSLAKLQSLSVIRLDLNYQISGPIPGFFANFSNLRVFSWCGNNISAPVPGFFANFSKLTSLSLHGCSLQGTFPKEIFQVPTLQIIDLSDNEELHGSLPEFPNKGSLLSLVLSFTKFSGLLPESIGNLKLLEAIDLSNCSFIGSLPKSMENLKQLVYLDISSNLFNGPISSIHWENLINLAHLNLDNNLLGGSIPSSLFSLPLLQEIVLSNNHFSGQLPEFSNVSSNLVTLLDLSFNNLEGPIPVSIFNFQGLEMLYLYSNNFSAFPFNGPQRLETLGFVDLSNNGLLFFYSGTNSSYSSFPLLSSLKLASNKLKTFPGFLRNQSYLEYLDLSDNQIQGEIPNWIWKLNSLNSLNLSCNSLVTLEAHLVNSSTLSLLDLHSNQLQGKFPIFLPNAMYLDYSRNNFSSSIPTDIGDFLFHIMFFSLSSNNLHGLIPVSICNASALQLLDLSNNSLSGMIPKCLTAGTLGALNLRRNKLTGNFSNSIVTEDCSLESLDLSGNQIEGQLPKSLANCASLKLLNLGNNHITDSFPCFLMKISNLRVLVLRSNRFYGHIGCPNSNGAWPLLQIMDIAHNNLNGKVPGVYLTIWRAMMDSKEDSEAEALEFTEVNENGGYGFTIQDAVTVTSKGLEMNLLKILTIFTLIDFSCNNFSGLIPEKMGEFKSLYVLNLSINSFTGEIPSSLGNMRKLESLDLSQNKLRGEIPPRLSQLNFLAFLNLSNNQLVGRIPTGTQFSTFPNTSFIGNKGLWGPPLTVDYKIGSSPPPTSNVSPRNVGYEIDWDLISVEIGFAFGFAVAVGSLVFSKRWSKWYYSAMYKVLVMMFPQLEERIGRHRRHVHINQSRRR